MSGDGNADRVDAAGLAGRLTDVGHELPVRVYFEDTDFSGFVYHASYVRWFERGRSDFLRLLGVNHAALFSGEAVGEPAAFVVRRLEVDYFKPAVIDDVLTVSTEVAELSAAACRLGQTIRRGDAVMARGVVQVVLVSLAGRPLRLGGTLKDTLSRFLTNPA